MTDAYFTDFRGGNKEAIASMVDFYGGVGTFASWPGRVRAYAVESTPVNILVWAGAYGFRLSAALLSTLDLPTLVICGGASHPAMQRGNELIAECVGVAAHVEISGAAHFMISTHAEELGSLIADHVLRAEMAES